MKHSKKLLAAAALLSAIAMSGCAVPAPAAENYGNAYEEENIQNEEVTQTEITTPALPPEPVEDKAVYIKVTADGVNIRSGAGKDYSAFGTAEKDTLYAYLGKTGGWYVVYYKNKKAYINENYCDTCEMRKSENAAVERVIEEGAKCLGVKYVYGAVRYHDGDGKLLKGFTKSAFDCSSLMQYAFKRGADVNLQVNTRTQIKQGDAVGRSSLKRGDLIFFTNASRQNKTGVERVGHVALYLGDNMILHTASDYAKIEKINSTRWGYYVQAKRMM